MAFITFEGCEGVGKSTQAKRLFAYLQNSGQSVVFTREPGGTPLAEKIRELILTCEMSAESEAELFASARCDHIDNLILPSIEAEKTVVCDRYIHSSIAYQGYARGLGEDRIKSLNFYAYEKCMPDAVVFIDMNPIESWRRRKGKIVHGDRMEAESDCFHTKVYEGFKALCETDERFIRIIPNENKEETEIAIRNALIERGLIK